MRLRLPGACGALVVAAGCSASLDTGHPGAAGAGGTGSVGTGLGGRSGGFAGAGGAGGTTFIGPLNNEVDILFMIDNSSEMTSMQEKLYAQLPVFVQSLQNLPVPPSVHIAVVSSDMGAPGDATSSIMCTKAGDSGQFQSMPRGTCTDTTLVAGDTFISDADMMPNYTDPLANVLQCIALLGDKRLRVRAPARVDRSRARRRTFSRARRRIAQHERRLPAARGRPWPSSS